jgi:hypothetical protein
VKKDESLELTRFQDSVFIKCVSVAGYNWEYLIIERNCELAASFGFFYIYGAGSLYSTIKLGTYKFFNTLKKRISKK